jgi:hypothetical protein
MTRLLPRLLQWWCAHRNLYVPHAGLHVEHCPTSDETWLRRLDLRCRTCGQEWGVTSDTALVSKVELVPPPEKVQP